MNTPLSPTCVLGLFVVVCSYETIGSLESVLDTEIRTIDKCTYNATEEAKLNFTVELEDGSWVPCPLLEWGSPSCWPDGSDSNISKDFLFRGMYYAQLVRFLQFVKRVSFSFVGVTILVSLLSCHDCARICAG